MPTPHIGKEIISQVRIGNEAGIKLVQDLLIGMVLGGKVGSKLTCREGIFDKVHE